MQNAGQFFSTARERYSILLRRRAGDDPPWTDDHVFQEWRFCCVHREDDRTTAWFRENVRKQLDGVLLSEGARAKLVGATLAFRWFNRVETAEKILDLLVGGWDSAEALRRLADVSPVVSGAYIILGRQGMNKLDGVLWCVDTAIREIRGYVAAWGETLEEAWQDLQTLPYMGRFMAYEIVTDLRHTSILNRASDIQTWANAGPGCARGVRWVLGDNSPKFNPGSSRDQTRMLEVMRELLEMSRDGDHWPAEWPAWEMREVEHWLCEYDKYRRAQRGDRMKRRFQ